MFLQRNWDVLLIGGASGVGKSSLSYPLARQFGVALTEVDDFQVILERMTTPEQQPVLHFWNTHPDPTSLSPERIVQQLIDIGTVMLPALEAVIANHLESARPVILDGDFILPALLDRTNFGGVANGGRVRGVFVIESDETQITLNYALREPDAGDQSGRAHVSWLYGEWLKREAERVGALVIESRPWESLVERAITALRSSP